MEKVALPHHALALLRMARGPESADRAQAWLNAAQPLAGGASCCASLGLRRARGAGAGAACRP
ncbi:MAG: hypothetical protein MZW92_65445 [Comamonadaceae bacterium]|nr:hypothetical protein [Comamonadaceae bacterium]